MATSILPALLTGLVQFSSTALPNVTVHDGYGATDDPGDFLMIGVDDPNSPNFATSATSAQAVATMGARRSRDELGDVTCVALSWIGDNDQQAARDTVFGITAALENALRADVTVGGVPGLLWAEFGTRLSLAQDNNEDGAQAWVIFSIHFKARI